MSLHRLCVAAVTLVTVVTTGLLSTGPAAAAPTTAAKTTTTPASAAFDKVVVKVDVAGGHTLSEVLGAFPVTLDRTLLNSRGIYLVKARRAQDVGTLARLTALASRLAASPAVLYAEPNFETTLNGSRFHSWPEGTPTGVQADSRAWLDQPASTSLRLDRAHDLSQGLGVRIAVLDTGVDPTHPALQGRLTKGYDYIDDDAVPTDVATRVDSNGNGDVDEAYGHGTFVAGMVGLVAPDARVMSYRVLDSDGVGNVFVVAQAILDAVDNKAKVINISFGNDEAAESRTLSEAVAVARSKGVVVVAAAGNDASSAAHFPAADPGVLSVSALNGASLASWANRGSWVKVAAPGSALVGPVPGGAYADWSGTSMATPIVTAQIALIRARFPTWTPAQQVAAVTSSSRPLAGVANGSVDLVGSLGG